MKTVLIVTHRRGFEADPVIDMLRKRNVPVFRFNGDNASMISFVINADKDDVFLTCDGIEIDKNQIGVAWCQQLPPFFNQPSDMSQCLQNGNIRIASFASLELTDLQWINSPSNVLSASNKIAQLILARKVGLNIPSTLVSNKPNHIRFFADRNTIIAKNLATPWVTTPEQKTNEAFTKIVKSEWLTSDAELCFSPIIYQSFHKRVKDYRVVVVGDKHFVVNCTPKEGQLEDIRRGSSVGEDFVVSDFDQSSLDALRLMMKNFGVDYCAADFMKDESGKLYFLEMNICGAWWWVDRLYDGAICEAIVGLIEKRLSITC